MGDENSLAGTTKAHKHTSPASDGGFLETTETGITNMSAGSIGYYDSSSVLQEISIGSASDQLRVNGGATAPEWFTPSSAGVTTNVQIASSATNQSTTSLTFVDVTSFSKTLSGSGAGVCNTVFNYVVENTNNYAVRWSYSVDGDQDEFQPLGQINYPNGNCYSAWTQSLNSQVCKMQMRMVAAGTVSMQPTSAYQSVAYWTEIS